MHSDAKTIYLFLNPENENIFDYKKTQNSIYVFYKNNSSPGNRYQQWEGIWAFKEKTVLEKTRTQKKWLNLDTIYTHFNHYEFLKNYSNIFLLFEKNIFVGESLKKAIAECASLIYNSDLFPPKKSDIENIILNAFEEDLRKKTIFSSEWYYLYQSFTGWNESS
jgi:hypothetical protein